jgi:ribonuclease HI
MQLPTSPKQALYTDGGVIGKNPSPIGGTWAWCLIENGEDFKRCGSGIVLPEDGVDGKVTNNVTELTAILEGMESLPESWQGVICSDSQITLGRVFEGWRLAGVPDPLYERLEAIRGRLRGDLARVKFQLLQGHPTRADLVRGVGKKRGLPVSQWNQWCDEQCSAEGLFYLHALDALAEHAHPLPINGGALVE